MFDKPPTIKTKVESTKEYSSDNMSFDAQYSRAEQLQINGAKVETVFIRPKNPKTEVPVLVLPGWGATMKSFKPGMKVLTERGRPVLSLNFPRQDGTIPGLPNEEVAGWYEKRGLKYPKWPTEFSRQANTIYELLNQEFIDKADVVAHSMAGPSVCIAAMLHPEKFIGRTIILTNSAGLIGQDSFFRLKKGADANTSRTPTMSEIPETKAETKYLEATKDITNQYTGLDNPLRNIKKIWRAGKEVWDISQVQITENMLRYLKEKGIKVIVVGAVEDTMFPMGTLSEQREVLGLNERKRFVGNKGMQKNVPGSDVAGFVSTIGGHMQIQVNSQEGIQPNFMSALETMLPKPEERKVNL